MIRKRLRKLLRKLIRWAFADEKGSFVISVGVEVGMRKCAAEDFFLRGLSGPKGRQVIVNNVKVARTNREL